jgi:hypothetical protein
VYIHLDRGPGQRQISSSFNDVACWIPASNPHLLHAETRERGFSRPRRLDGRLVPACCGTRNGLNYSPASGRPIPGILTHIIPELQVPRSNWFEGLQSIPRSHLRTYFIIVRMCKLGYPSNARTTCLWYLRIGVYIQGVASPDVAQGESFLFSSRAFPQIHGTATTVAVRLWLFGHATTCRPLPLPAKPTYLSIKY